MFSRSYVLALHRAYGAYFQGIDTTRASLISATLIDRTLETSIVGMVGYTRVQERV